MNKSINTLYEKINSYADYTDDFFNEDNVNDSDKEWVFKPVYRFLNKFSDVRRKYYSVDLQVNQQYNNSSFEIEVFIDFRFNNHSVDILGFVTDMIKFTKKDEDIKGVKYSLDKNENNEFNFLSVALYLTKPRRFNIGYREIENEFIYFKSGSESVTNKLESGMFEGLSEKKASKVIRKLNELWSIVNE